jgi:hypothetical protein
MPTSAPSNRGNSRRTPPSLQYVSRTSQLIFVAEVCSGEAATFFLLSSFFCLVPFVRQPIFFGFVGCAVSARRQWAQSITGLCPRK